MNRCGVVLVLFATILGVNGLPAAEISDVRVSERTLDVGREATVALEYRLSEDALVSVSVYDPDGGLIVELISEDQQAAGVHAVTWDGRDLDGLKVPDEAYGFEVKTDSGSVFSSAHSDGGRVDDIASVDFEDEGIVTYSLHAPSRVLIRLGIQNGPMLKTLVDWRPRSSGVVTEFWDGYGQDKHFHVVELPSFTVMATSVELPSTVVITYGNREETYREYKLGRGKDRPQRRAHQTEQSSDKEFRPDLLVPPAWARAPQVAMSFPNGTNGDAVPSVKRTVDVRIDVGEEDRPLLMEDQFEVLLFVDGQFFAEAERGYLPLNWKWELHQFPPGEHVLTANISSFRGQVGVASRKIVLEP